MKETQFLNIENPPELFQLLDLLNAGTPPMFGKMTSQHMVEHLEFSVCMSYDKYPQKLAVTEETAEKAKRFVVGTTKELPKGVLFPGTGGRLPQINHPEIKTAIKVLRLRLEEFHNFFQHHNQAQTIHPVFGKLNYPEWIIFHNKHFTHHFKQFNLL